MNNPLIGCSLNCTWNVEAPCGDPISDVTIKRLVRQTDIYSAWVMSDMYGGILQRQYLSMPSVVDSRCPDGSLPDDYCMVRQGLCDGSQVASLSGLLLSDLQKPGYLYANQTPTPGGLNPVHSDCCNLDYCKAVAEAYAPDFGCNATVGCTDKQLLRMAINMTISSNMLAMAREQVGPSVCPNITSTEASDFRLVGMQMACCSGSMYQLLHESCVVGGNGSTWQMDERDAGVIARLNVSVDQGDTDGYGEFGFYTQTYEDGAPDVDENDLAARERQICIYRSDIASDYVLRPLVCTTTVHPVARGGGYDNQILLSLDAEIDPGRFPPQRPPILACLTTDPVPPNIVLPPSQVVFHGNASDAWHGVTGTVAVYRAIKEGQTEMSAGALRSQCWIASVNATPFYPHLYPSCEKNMDLEDFEVIPDTRLNLQNSPPSSPRDTYPNAFNNTQAQTPNSYDLLVFVTFSTPATYGFSVTRQYDGVPRFRFYLKNLSCDWNIDLMNIDPNFLNVNDVPYAITSPRTPWCWPLEGVPIVLPPSLPGQCMFGRRTGQSCTETVTQCPYSFCRVSVGQCFDGSGPCDAISQCPYGLECYRGSGAFPFYLSYHECVVADCYTPSPPDPYYCTLHSCYEPEIEFWEYYPNVDVGTHVRETNLNYYVPDVMTPP